MTWKKLSSTQVYQNRYMTVVEEELVTDHNDPVTYGVVKKEDFVIIIPWDGERVLLVGQYRYPVDYVSWEFPMGHVEKTNVKTAALAELQQETGLIAHDLAEIGTFFPAPSFLSQTGHLFIATKYDQGERQLEPSEKGMQMKWVTLEEMNDLIHTGTIKDGVTIACLKLFELHFPKLK